MSGGQRPRPGSQALSLLAMPLNYHVLRALEDGPCPLLELRRVVGSPPQTTMRGYMKTLTEMGVLERRRQNDFPGSVEYELTRGGEKLLEVADVLQHWLDLGAYGPISLGTPAARSTVKAVVDGWATNMIRALAARPISLTELARFLPAISYPTLERRLSAMHHVGLVERHRDSNGRGTPYKVTEWLRRSVAPITAAVGWEYRAIPELTGPISRIDVESTFLLTVPLLELPPDISGSCRLSVELRHRNGTDYAGVSVTVDEGEITSCVSRLQSDADAWVAGTPLGWFRWVTRHANDSVEIGGDNDLAHGLAEGIHNSLVKMEQGQP
ncbi:MAG TPA: winged helix-turn-helix transcriptional regulator [Solirubrobacterales bacterium]|nr:winged helix-turn-helix transcriptional regulator [Solirubrobacterales bacterium]